MIDTISICNLATFRGEHEMGGLSRLNFVFGSNGVGKTTVSRVIESPGAEPGCGLSGVGARSLETLVCNRDFVEKNLSQSANIRGVFTLGEKRVETLAKIEGARAAIASLDRDLRTLTNSLEGGDGRGGAREQLRAVEDRLKRRCWESKIEHDGRFAPIFKGLRSKADLFRDRVLQERRHATGQPVALEDLRERARAVFDEDSDKETLLLDLDGSPLASVETEGILERRIVGREDVGLATIINRLGNSDWVQSGRVYLEKESALECPFCQETLPVDFRTALESYFDEAYSDSIRTVKELDRAYSAAVSGLAARLGDLVQASPRFLDTEALAAAKEHFDTAAQLNLARLKAKVQEPSSRAELVPTDGIIENIGKLIDDANAKTKAHNAIAANLEKEREALDKQIWAYIVGVERADDLRRYDKERADTQKAITNLQEEIEDVKRKREEQVDVLRRLERDVTSTQPTVDRINDLLASLGFSGFELAQAEGQESYKLLRPDGSDAKETLSEGERSFLTFLYFYHRLKGNTSATDVGTDRVVVFDDPVSSLDSNVLFVVSSLIRGVAEDIRTGTGPVKQLFVLTHNAYFHREVTFDYRRTGARPRNDETFWIVRKVAAASTIERQDSNPVRTSYDLLWEEVRSPQPGSATLQNTLRRILENYFKILGGVDLSEIAAKFQGQDQAVCRSLFAWVNAGSHYALDDIFIAPQDTADHYLRVFQEVFELTGHRAHYMMMMRADTGDGSDKTSPGQAG